MTNIKDLEPEPYVISLSRDGREALSFEPRELSGWAAYFSDEVERARMEVFIRVGPRVGGTDVAEPVIVDGRPGVRMSTPRITPGVPLEIREMRMVAKSGADASSTVMRTIPWDRIEAAINQPRHRETLDRWVQPAFSVAEDIPGKLHSFHIFRPEPLEQPDLQMEIPQGYRKPDEFYRQVGELYLWLAAVSSRPAQELAAANNVKPTTVHRWIREAKARGLIALASDRS